MDPSSFLPFLLLASTAVEARFEEVHPAPLDPAAFERTPGRERAVVLIHGLKLHPFSARKAARAELHSWQRPGSRMVAELGAAADIFAFAYGQTAPVEEIARLDVLSESLARVKGLGYSQVVLVGHSAGALIARQFVEDHSGAGVTKVVQICAPNLGSWWAYLECSVRANQEPFLRSLTAPSRERFLAARAEKKFPAGVDFICVIADGAGLGDWVVADSSQWPADLRAQGVPVVRTVATHGFIFTRRAARLVAELVERPPLRWSPAAVAAAEARYLAPPSLKPAWDAARQMPAAAGDCMRRAREKCLEPLYAAFAGMRQSLRLRLDRLRRSS